ncbi:hypothetical protein [Marivita sp. S2033]|uniref:hypothetical protein n=1 Tax=Marivita sp. S2033 TaxID=3373187 RepID=UPI003981FBA5
MMIATALVTTLSTAAFAASEAQIQEVQTFSADIDTSSFTDTQYDIAYGIIHAGMSQGEKIAKLRALAEDTDNSSMADIGQAELQRLKEYAPDADFTNATKAQVQSALAVTYGGESEGVKSDRVKNIFADHNSMETMNMEITAGEAAMIQEYAPNVDVSTLTDQQVQTIKSFIYSDMSRGEKVGKIESIVMN